LKEEAMARCEGTTRSGDRCKREARPDSRFCHIHDQDLEGTGDRGAATDELEFVDLVPILLAGLLAAGLVFFLKGFGRWIPRI
jgi:hypothetical protein